MPTGSNPSLAVLDQLTHALGGPPTDDQLRDGVARFLTQNQIVDATKIAAGTHLNMESVNQLAGEILGSHQLLPADLAALPGKLPLPTGSDIWKQSAGLIEYHLKRTPTPFEVFKIAKKISRASGIKVLEWGLPGNVDHNNIPAGFMLTLDDEVKEELAALAA